jgi:hypothetical protein
MANGLSDELEVCRVEMRSLLTAQASALDALIHEVAAVHDELVDGDRRVVFSTVSLMLQALGVSIHSSLRLTVDVDMAIRDAFGIARSAAELGVNIAYIAVGGFEVAQRAQRHALQKVYRDRERRGTIGGVHVDLRSPVPPVEDIPGLKAALAEFTDAKGRERRGWTDVNLDDRIALVRSKHPDAALALAGAIFAIYRHSSELLHGTYFGVVFFWTGSGVKQRPYSRDAFALTWLSDHFTAIFTALFFAANGAIETVRAVYGLVDDRQPSLIRRANDLTERMNSLLSRGQSSRA